MRTTKNGTAKIGSQVVLGIVFIIIPIAIFRGVSSIFASERARQFTEVLQYQLCIYWNWYGRTCQHRDLGCDRGHRRWRYVVTIRAFIGGANRYSVDTESQAHRMRIESARTARRLAGRCIVALLSAGILAGAWNAQAEPVGAVPSYAVAMTLDAGGAQSAPRVLARAGEQFAVASGGWRLEMTVRQAQTPGDVWVAGKLFKGSEIVGAPTLLAHLNEKTTITLGDSKEPFSLSVLVAQASPAPGQSNQ